MSSIPEARARILAMIENPYLPIPFQNELKEIVLLLDRRKAIRKAPRTQTQITPQIRARIHFLAKNTDLSQGAIASAVGLGPQAYGRISEVLHGLR